MKRRPVILLTLALALLLSWTAGLHFHVSEPHHGPPSVDVHAQDWLLLHGLLAGQEGDHHQDHLAGAQDVQASVTPVGSMVKTILLLTVLAFIGLALWWMPLVGFQLPARGPFRPPRLRSPAEILPPSQGPPLAA